MSTITDLLQLADRILGFFKKREQTDAVLFEGLIDPVYVQLATIVPEMINLYRPTATALSRLSKLHTDMHHGRVHALWESIHGKNARPIENKHEAYDAGLKEIFAEVPRHFVSAHGTELRAAIDAFKELRAETRPARIKADAAACALIDHYATRDDVFATRVCEFATQLRILVGRAHNRPLERSNGETKFRPGTSRVENLLERLERAVRRTELSFEVDRQPKPLTETVEGALDANVETKDIGLQDLEAVSAYIEQICTTINTSWETMIYVYARLRLAIMSKR